ncbi:MAG: DUF2809 domain-containing protein [Clostridiaceae bacterium]|jgi:hypothetical protein|nr:DUF2809 domain-containing protein [Clostridiaceae bacterium]
MKSNRKIVYIILTIICFAICALIVAFFSKARFIRGFAGDVVIIALLYFLIKVFIDAKPLRLALFTLASAFTVEFLQYFRIIDLLGLEKSKIARIVIGSVFDPMDLLAYFIGAVLVYIIDSALVEKYILEKQD